MDLSIAHILKDSKDLINIEEHFKLVAGPGAGKTTFLCNHIRNILANSKRLSNSRKVACITYTNVGVDTIVSRLHSSINNVEVGTIHNFLFKNIVKPYLWVLENEFEFNYSQIDGHDVVVPTYSILKEFCEKTSQVYLLKQQEDLINALSHLEWKYADNNIDIGFSRVYHGRVGSVRVKKDSLMIYKKICWKKGIISHDDVLFLSYKIINKQKRVLDILRAKFPYLLIDEFQDTNPIQTYIVSKIAECETVVGVIGDVWQSIYEFQGAKPRDFEQFDLKDMKIYKLENNHRSTKQIIDVLNSIRNDNNFIQNSPDNKVGDRPIILVGNSFKAYEEAVKICGKEELYMLTYTNKTANKIKYNLDDENNYDFSHIINKLSTFDDKRGQQILNIIYSIEYCRENKLKESIKYMRKAFRKDKEYGDREALQDIQKLIHDYGTFSGMNLLDFYTKHICALRKYASKIQVKNKPTKVAEFYSNHSYKEVATALSLQNDDDSKYKTIHKAKGDEFDNVLVIISKDNDNKRELELQFLLNSDKEEEKDKLYYVALSRAKKRLFINVPDIEDETRNKLSLFTIKDV